MAEDEDLSPISGCPPGQRSGLMLKFPFFVPCGCWDDLFIPIGLVANLLRRALRTGLREASEKVLRKTLLKSRLEKLAKKKIFANKAFDALENIWKDIAAKLYKLESQLAEETAARLAKIKKITSLEYANGFASLRNTIKWWQDEIKRIEASIPIWKSKILKLQEQYPGQTYFPGWHLGRAEYFAQYGTDYPAYAIQRQKAVSDYYIMIDHYARAKSDIEMFKKSIADNIQKLRDLERSYGDSIKEEVALLEAGIREHLRIEKMIQAKIDLPRPSRVLTPPSPGNPGRTIPQGTYQEQLDYLTGQSKELNDHMRVIEELEDSASTATGTKIEELNQRIDQWFPDIAYSMIEVIADLLATFTIVGPHLCREGSDGVTLNLENCKCDICPPDKQLCQPISFDPGIRLPWTALADSANYCLDPCCGGQVDESGNPLRVYEPSTYIFNGGIGELLGVEQCACGCPGDLVKKPCVNSICNDNFICENDFFPDDQCTSLRLFSKFYWNDGSNGKDCGYRCSEELSDADCFAFYGQYTKWSSRTDLQYCNCVCKDKSETNCPEKATYSAIDTYHLPEGFTGTYCDILENPIQPVCTCVCDRPDDCPQGQVLNRLVTGPNACECVPEYDGYPYGSQQTYYFDNNSQSWTITQDS